MNRINLTMSASAGALVDLEVIKIKEVKVVCLGKVEQNTNPIFLEFKEHTGNVDG